MANERFCLKWNDFQSCASQEFHSFRQDKEFFDVTLVSEDLEQFELHKIVLSASSNFFRNILRKIVHTHPLLYLHGIHSTSLQLILDYVQQGEVQIYQEQLDQFLKVASDLQIKGLQESVKNDSSNIINEDNISNLEVFGNHKDYEDKNSFNIVSSENENKVQNVKIAFYESIRMHNMRAHELYYHCKIMNYSSYHELCNSK